MTVGRVSKNFVTTQSDEAKEALISFFESLLVKDLNDYIG